jgi:hypothetical protein
MDEDRPWEGEEPSARPDPTFRPVPAAIGVFTAVAAPIVFYAVARAGGTDVTVLVVGLGVALVAAVAAGLFVAARGGRVTDRRQL